MACDGISGEWMRSHGYHGYTYCATYSGHGDGGVIRERQREAIMEVYILVIPFAVGDAIRYS